MTVRPFQPGDREAIKQLWISCGLVRPWNDPDQDISRATSRPNCTILVGLLDGEVIATVMVGYDGHRGWLYYAAVQNSHQRQGFGRQIIASAEEWLAKVGAPKVMLLVRETNRSVVGFYESLDYSKSETVTLEKWLTPDGRRAVN